ncbi:two-component sensor histidine kinase [Erwinia billingiae]|nr:two-component sensor histidine kinase [Erwinia billingiae]
MLIKDLLVTFPLIKRSLIIWLLLMAIPLMVVPGIQLYQQWKALNKAFQEVELQIAYRLTQNAAVLPLISPGSDAKALNHKFPQIVAIEPLPGGSSEEVRITLADNGRYWLNNPWQNVRELVDFRPVIAAALQQAQFSHLTLSWQENVLLTAGSGQSGGIWHWSTTFAQEIQPFELTADASANWAAVKIWPSLLLALLLSGLVLLLHQLQRQRQADRRAQFYQHSQLNALGEITAGMVHEINQPLTAIQTWLQGAQRLVAKGDLSLLPKALEGALSQTQRIALLLQRFRDHLEQREVKMEAVDVKRLWGHVEDLLAREIREGEITVQRDFVTPAPLVRADRLWLEQVLHNLLSNAVQAQSAQRKGWVRVQCRVDDRSVLITLTDGGKGFSEEGLKQALMPFYTTRAEGIGLGMTLAETLVLRMNGTIRLSNHEAGGACIHLRFQLWEKQ